MAIINLRLYAPWILSASAAATNNNKKLLFVAILEFCTISQRFIYFSHGCTPENFPKTRSTCRSVRERLNNFVLGAASHRKEKKKIKSARLLTYSESQQSHFCCGKFTLATLTYTHGATNAFSHFPFGCGGRLKQKWATMRRLELLRMRALYPSKSRTFDVPRPSELQPARTFGCSIIVVQVHRCILILTDWERE